MSGLQLLCDPIKNPEGAREEINLAKQRILKGTPVSLNKLRECDEAQRELDMLKEPSVRVFYAAPLD